MQAVLQAYDHFDLANFVTIAIAVQQAIGIGIVLHAGWGVEGLVINTGLGWLIGVVVGALQIRRVAKEFHWSSPARGLTRRRLQAERAELERLLAHVVDVEGSRDRVAADFHGAEVLRVGRHRQARRADARAQGHVGGRRRRRPRR